MEYNKKIADIKTGDSIESFYLLKEAAIKTTAAGKPFLSVRLMDNSGVITGTMWDYTGSIGAAEAGKIVKVRGSVNEYKGTLQLTIEKIRMKADSDTVAVTELVPSAPVKEDVLLNEILGLMATMKDEDFIKVCAEMLEIHQDKWTKAPAAIGMHHAFLSGLMMHTMMMCKAADFYGRLYAGFVNRDLLLAGAFLHDFGKLSEYELSELGLATGYTLQGTLVGHLVLGAEEIRDVAKRLQIPEEKSLLLEHMVLSHHGKPEWGACTTPACVEAELLAEIDLIDARAEGYREAFENMEPGTISGKIFALDGKRIYRPTF